MDRPRKYARWLPIAVSVCALVGSILTAVFAAGGRDGAEQTVQTQHTATLTDHEQRIHRGEIERTAIAGDVRWIRQAVERIENRIGGSP